VDREFALDYLDVALDALRRVRRKSQDVTGVGQHFRALPCLQHLAILGDPVLALGGTLQTFGIDVLKPDENFSASRALCLLDEVRDFVAHRIDLHDDVDLQVVAALQLDDAIENRLPVLVAREVVIGDEEAFHALRRVRPNQPLDIVGAAMARLAPLYVDDRAEAATEGASPARVEASERTGVSLYVPCGKERQRLALHCGQVGHEVVKRLESVLERGGQQVVEAIFGLAREQGDPARHRVLHLGRHFGQHRDASADMEAADRRLDSRGAQLRRNIDGTRELVGLHADHQHETAIRIARETADYRPHRNLAVGLVVRFDLDIDLGAEYMTIARVQRQTIDTRQRIRRYETAPPLDNVAVVVVVRRLDQLDQGFFVC